MNAFNFSELFMDTPGLVARPTGDGVGYRLYDMETSPSCPLGVVVDGQPIQTDMGEELGETVSVQNVLAVEVYPCQGVGAPQRYQVRPSGKGNCGVVLIWTKNH